MLLRALRTLPPRLRQVAQAREEIAILQELIRTLRSGQLPLGIVESPGYQLVVMELAAQLNNRHVDPMALSIKLHALRALGRADEAAAAVIELEERRRDPRLVPWLHVTALTEEVRYAVISGDVIRVARWNASWRR